REQQQADGAGAASRVPEQGVVHGRLSGCGQPATRLTAPSAPTSRAGMRLDSSQESARSPRTMAAVEAVLAATHVRAATLTVRQGPAAGRPLAASMMWCCSTPPRVQRRTVLPEVARPPSLIVI